MRRNGLTFWLAYLALAVGGLIMIVVVVRLIAVAFFLELHWPATAEEWIAWLSLGVAYGTLALAISTLTLARYSAISLREAREAEGRDLAVEFNKVASLIRNATTELMGFYQMGDSLMQWTKDRDPSVTYVDIEIARRPHWRRWDEDWHAHRGEYFAYLDLVGAGLPVELLNRLQVTGKPTIDNARDVLKNDKAIIAALKAFIDIIEETMEAVARSHGLTTALLAFREDRKPPTGTPA